VKLLPLILCTPCLVFAQTTTYTNQYGQTVGTSTTVNNTTYYSNQHGQPVGTAINAPQMPQTPPTVLATPVYNGYTPMPMSPQPPILPALPLLK
jgi:hypothetical protein